ncbi:MAG: polymer-forming cytoskeletal protein [Saprospiraceae bacterium]|nr:polymer-forming cytoskeletal protein [Saprospiraceae bacterium]
MFGTNTKEKKNGASAGASINSGEKEGAATTVIAKGTVIEGKFACAENVRLDGAIHGEVRIEKRFVMGDGSQVLGNIYARDAAIKGRIKGDVHVKEALHLMESAVIEGNIAAKTMIVEEGARYNGSCQIGDVAAVGHHTNAKN